MCRWFFDVTKTWFESTSDESAGVRSDSHTAPGSTRDENTLPFTDALHSRATAGSHPVDGTLPLTDAPQAHADESFGVDPRNHNPSSASLLPNEGGLESLRSGDFSTNLPPYEGGLDSLPSADVSPNESHSAALDTISFDSDSSMPPIVDFLRLAYADLVVPRNNQIDTHLAHYSQRSAHLALLLLVFNNGRQRLIFIIPQPRIWSLQQSSGFTQQINALIPH